MTTKAYANLFISAEQKTGPSIQSGTVYGTAPWPVHTMTASEQTFFLGAPLSHVVAYEEHRRASRLEMARRNMSRRRGHLRPWRS